MQDNQELFKELPQLIVGLDTLDESANYIHICDAKEDVTYYCPCCKGQIKPRAYKKDKTYEVQPHFYHVSGGCSDETYVHYICKHWLFEKGCKFIVNNITYEVDSVEIEKTLYTSFGDYRPDIIITTSIGKVFYFEIQVTNSKTEFYIPKWDELGNDVVEVNTQYFINQKFKGDIPQFNLIYSGGICFIKKYVKHDYNDTIAKRKLEWRRQDKLNYKIQWEKLDWFWTKLQEYRVKEDKSELLESFSNMDYTDKVWCYKNVKNKKCVSVKEDFLTLINRDFYNMIDGIVAENKNITISVIQKSPLIYIISCLTHVQYLDYDLHDSIDIKFKISRNKILDLSVKSEILREIKNLEEKHQNILVEVNYIKELETKKYIDHIVPVSHLAAKEHNFSDLYFEVFFKDKIHSNYIFEPIGSYKRTILYINDIYIDNMHTILYKESKDKLDIQFQKAFVSNNSEFWKVINQLEDMCSKSDLGLNIRVSDSCDCVILYGSWYKTYYISENAIIGEFENDMKEYFINEIKNIQKIKQLALYYVEKINRCKNKLWSAELNNSSIELSLHCRTITEEKIIYLFGNSDVKQKLTDNMNMMLNHIENYHGIRFMEVR